MSLLKTIKEMKEENYDVLRPLLKKLKIKEIDLVNEDGDTALHIAASRRWSFVVHKLLNHKATVDCLSKRGETPLQLAFNTLDVHDERLVLTVKKLLEKNANPNLKNKDGETPLHLAVKLDLVDAAEALLSKNANPNIGNYKGRTPLHYAALIGSWVLADKLVGGGAQNIYDHQRGETPLHLACMHNNRDVMAILLNDQNIINVDSRNRKNERAICLFLGRKSEYSFNFRPFIAYHRDHWMDIFRNVISAGDHYTLLLLWKFNKLLDEKSKIMERSDRIDFLFYACNKGSLRCVDLILRIYGGDVNYRKESGDTPLCNTLRMGHMDIAIMLIDEYKADINLAGESLDSPLHSYMRYWDPIGTRELLKRGANVDALNQEGKTPIYYARNPILAELLLDYGTFVSFTNVTDYQAITDEHVQKDDLIEGVLKAIIRWNVANKHLNQQSRHIKIQKKFRKEFVTEYERLCEAEWEEFTRVEYDEFKLTDLLENEAENLYRFSQKEELNLFIYEQDFADAFPELSRLAKAGYWKMQRRLVSGESPARERTLLERIMPGGCTGRSSSP